jgi:fused signal recognition particle receptor
MFWRKKKNQGEQERQELEDRIIHPPQEPVIETTIDDADVVISEPNILEQDLHATEAEVIDGLDITPTPEHTPVLDAEQAEEFATDHVEEGGWLSRMATGLTKSTNRLGKGISDILLKRKLDDDALQDLEDLLITSDIGPRTSAEIIQDFKKLKFDKDIEPFEVKAALADIIGKILEPVTKPLVIEKPANGPFVILVCGVNGAGKTTTIGKLAHDWHLKQHKKVMIGAADTFRAAAVDQLEVWANRAHVPLFKKEIGADAAAVAYESYKKAKDEGVDILMIDTAGRLQNKSNLMAELEKVVRVLKKHDESIPHAVLLVLDATTGQNAHSQLSAFKEAVDITGLIVTKLDGSARGGVVVSLAQEFGIPIHAIGVGEAIEDLSPFEAHDYAKALMGTV